MYLIPFNDLQEWQELGQGAFGKVYKADYLGTEVAIKQFLDISQIPNFDLKKYTDREVSFLQECRHPNVVQFMGCCENELKIYAVTEFVEGGNLKELILKSITTSKPIKWRLRISFAEDCARALAYLHARQIIHRDLKSENLLLTANKRIKVCDFGLSRETPRNVEERRRLSFCGTDAYMAPEIVLGMPFDTSVDIFSFGIILLELIFGVVGDAPDQSPATLNLSSLKNSDSGPKMDSDRVHMLFWRVIPGFGVDCDKLKELLLTNCSSSTSNVGGGEETDICPAAFFDLAMECVKEEPKHRPLLRDILKRLRAIEGDIIRSETEASAVNVGVFGSDTNLSRAFSQDISDSAENISKSLSHREGLSMQFSSIPEVSATGGAEVADAVETVVPKENINQIQAPTPSTPLQQQQKLQNNEAKDNVNVSTPYETASPTSTSSPTIRKVESNSLGRKRLPSANDATILPQQQLHELTKALSRSRLSSSLNDLKSIIASGSPTISSHNSIANLSSMENGAQYLAEHSNSSSSIVAARVGHIIPHRFSLVYLPTISKCRVCTHGFKLTSRHLVCDDCEFQVHKSCANSAPPTCGFSKQAVKALNKLQINPVSPSDNKITSNSPSPFSANAGKQQSPLIPFKNNNRKVSVGVENTSGGLSSPRMTRNLAPHP